MRPRHLQIAGTTRKIWLKRRICIYRTDVREQINSLVLVKIFTVTIQR
jgi:hypothetical protein